MITKPINDMKAKVTRFVHNLEPHARVELLIAIDPLYDALAYGVSRDEICLMLGDKLLEELENSGEL